MIDIDEWNIERTGKSLCETCTYEERAHKSRTARKGHSRYLFLSYSGPLNGLIDNRNDILLMSTRRKFGHNTTVSLVHFLRGSDITQNHLIL